MWEIDVLLTNSIALIKVSNLDNETKKHIVWNLECIPDVYQFDAGGFNKSELDDNFQYKNMNPFALGLLIIQEAKNSNHNLIYVWSAFLLNFWSEYFSSIDNLENIKFQYLKEMKAVFNTFDFINYKPIHASLTLYKAGNKWFTEEQNNLIKWYCN